jgi:prepilin-type N-terminal cleavage/methylation domain-containing protein
MNSRAPGMTLIELLVVAVVGSLILLAIHQTLSIQERGSRHQRGIITAQQSSRMALEVLVSELRELSATGGDLLAASPNELTLRTSRKLGFVCRVTPGDSQFDVWERGEPFQAGDSLLLFMDGDTTTTADDAWGLGVISAAEATGASASCPDWSSGGVTLPRRRLTLLNGATLAAVARGAPVRSFVRYSYGLYDMDGEWVLGRAADGEVVPLVGPLVADGLVLDYIDANGTSLDPVTEEALQQVARIHVTVRALAPGAVGSGEVVNTLESQLFLRNH